MLETAKSVLVVIDVQEKLTRLVYQPESLIASLEKLICGVQVLGVPIIVTEQYPKGLGPTIPEIAHLLESTPALPKTSFSCCGDENFLREFKALDRKQVLVCGIESHVCVYQTAADMAAAGYEPYVVTDAVSSRTPENRQIGFSLMERAGARLTSTEAVLFEMLRVAQGEQFRKISRIVR